MDWASSASSIPDRLTKNSNPDSPREMSETERGKFRYWKSPYTTLSILQEFRHDGTVAAARAAHSHARTGVQLNARFPFPRPILAALRHSADSGENGPDSLLNSCPSKGNGYFVREDCSAIAFKPSAPSAPFVRSGKWPRDKTVQVRYRTYVRRLGMGCFYRILVSQ